MSYPMSRPSRRFVNRTASSNMEMVTKNLIDEIGSLKAVVDKNNTDAAILFRLIDKLIAAYKTKEDFRGKH